MNVTLWLAALYNVAWGGLVVLFPLAPFAWAGMAAPRYPEIWQCVGMIVGVYGVGYAIAAFDPARHWAIILVGFIGKVFGPIGFLIAFLRGDLPWVAGWTILTNDLLWWWPFAVILWRIRQVSLESN
ncbi:MAG: alkyl hydroperoxide reductase [Acidobacteria bacterium]|nr:alkyl hydroperoxide reductase [Acidobacteriota bacterium]